MCCKCFKSLTEIAQEVPYMKGFQWIPNKKEIGEGFSNEFKLTRLAAELIKENLDKSPIEIGNLIVREFNSQGVVIKVEGELPDCILYKEKMIMEYDCPLLNAGYVKTKPLIESDSKGIDGNPYIVGASGMGSAIKPLIGDE